MFLELSHTKTPVFQQTEYLALESYRITKTFPADGRFAMVQQIPGCRRRAGSARTAEPARTHRRRGCEPRRGSQDRR